MAGVVRSVQSFTKVLTACRLLSRIACPPRAASYYLCKDQLAITTYVPERRSTVLAAAANRESSSSQWQSHQLDRALQRIDNEVRRTGRVTRRDLDDVLSQASALGRLSGPQGLLLVRMCGAFLREEPPSERQELARAVWENLQSFNCPLDVSHYNALLQVYLENEFPFCPSTFLATMEAASVQPNRVTFQRLIHRYCQQGDIGGASKILEHMKSQDMAINEKVFNSLVLGHCRAGDTESAWNVLEVMRNAQLEPTADTFHALLVGCAERGDQAGLERALREADRVDTFLPDELLLDVVRVLACAGHHSMLDMLLERTRRLAGYTQDCINVCLQLLAQGQDEVAYRMLLTMDTPRNEYHGNFFVSQMVRRGLPLERVLHYCKDLQSRGLNSRALVRCAEVALANRSELALPLLREMHQQGMPLRTHYFYPLVLAQGSNEQGIYDVIKEMMDLGVDANYDLLAEYVFPAVNTEDAATVVEKLKGLGLSVSSIVNPLVLHHLQASNLDKALAVVEQFPVNLVPSLVVPSLAACYRDTRQAVPAVKLLSMTLQGPEATATGTSRTDWAGRFLTECLVDEPALHLNNLIPELLANKVHISRSTADTLRARHGQSLNGSILDMLDQISAEKLDDFGDSRLPSQNDMGIEELEAHLLELQSKGMNTRGALRRLLLLHCRFRHVERALSVAEQLRQEGCTFTGAMHAQLLDLFVSMGDLERARDHMRLVRDVDPSFRLDSHKLLGLAALEASRGHTDEALRLLEEDTGRSNDGGRQTQQTGLDRVAARLLTALAEQGGPVERALQLLLERCWVSPSSILLAPLVRAHLVKDDIPGALKTFEEYARRYRLTPLKGELSRHLINKELSEELQKVVDISTEVHGEANTLFDLTAYFLECGHVRQAQKILETPGLRARHERLNQICENFLRRGMVTQLEQLVTITRSVFDVNRDSLYQSLFRAYDAAGDADRALEAWAQMQEENEQPSERTLRLLAALLQRLGRPVPFTVPTVEAGAKQDNFDTLLTSDPDAALDLWHRGQVSGRQKGFQLLQALTRQGRTREALRLLDQLLQTSEPAAISARAVRPLLQQLASLGEVESLVNLRSQLPERLLRQLSYDNLLCNAYVHSGRAGDLLSQLENAPGEWVSGGRCPFGGLVGLLTRHPEMAGRVEALGRTYGTEHDCWTPLNALWSHRVLQQDYAGADQLLKEFPQLGPQLLFVPVMHESRDKKDERMARYLADTLAAHGSSPRSQAVAQSNLIRVLALQGSVDEALKLLQVADESSISPWALVTLRDALEAAGKPVPFQVPQSRQQEEQQQDHVQQ
ncbi:leucine-rich PPR motif-containing protein, mitochondrial [Dermacentor andersoni]|uniref:leucine-rich PPR motif-containing protein, mitochondrial n=1 Tax=Dermacentor andersoni TaxID=34620 RepID=UPI002155D054|nr:leucine-rich PPR motif-containing protein, mitochondrial-like [Dermacentor andersoni]